jgi:hypothetical protein
MASNNAKEHISKIEVEMSDLIDVNLLQNPMTDAGFEGLPKGNDKTRSRCGICYRFTKGNNRIERVLPTLSTELRILHEVTNAKKINNKNIIAHT